MPQDKGGWWEGDSQCVVNTWMFILENWDSMVHYVGGGSSWTST